jgi:hypothetical protein
MTIANANYTTPEQPEPPPRVVWGLSLATDDAVIEEIIPATGQTQFVARYRDGKEVRLDSLGLPDGSTLKPLLFEDLDALRLRHLGKSVVLLPAGPRPFRSVEDLDRRLSDHISRYTQVPLELAGILPLYIRYTWLADRFQTAPYLRLTGPSGSGKSRTSQIVGHLCRKPYMTNATASEASLNRTMQMLGVCTTVIDESEHEPGSESQVATTKMLRVGFEANGAVERCDEVTREGTKTHRPVRLPVFGPKIICAIKHVPDKALHSRSIPVRMVESRTMPIELPASYPAEVLELQAMLLRYRLDHFFAPLPEPQRLLVAPRLLQLYWPLAKVATPGHLPDLNALIFEMQEERDSEAQLGPEPRIAEAIRSLAEDPKVEFDEVATRASRSGEPVSPQEVGYFVKNRLGLNSRRAGSNRGPRWIYAPKEAILTALETAGYGQPEPEAKAA